MTRILLRSSKTPFEAATIEETIQQKIGGQNLGNLVFSDSAYKMLNVPGTEITTTGFRTGVPEPEQINEEYDYFVLPFANAFRPSFRKQLDSWTDVIEKLTIPVMVLSVGAQSSLDYDLEPMRPMDESVKRFASAVLDRAPSLGVRGEFTQRYLNHLGFKDVEVIGCPSMFRYGRSLSVEKRTAELDTDARIGMYTTNNTMGDLGRIVMENYRRYPNLRYIAQDIPDLERLYWGDVSLAADQHKEMPVLRSHPLFEENRVRLHLDPITWIRELRDYDFVFGTRIHGNVVSLLAGTPAVVMCHDSRTLELSEYFEIPHRRMTEPTEAFDAAKLYEHADYTGLVKGHGERFERMTGYVERHGLPHIFQPDQDGGAAFEERINSISFTPPVEAWSDEDGGFGYRIGWLKESVRGLSREQQKSQKKQASLQKSIAQMTKEQASLQKTVTQLNKRLASLEKESKMTPYRRARRVGGRVLRRFGLRR
ncbi:polysaccharide pyruvyl transferase family protein [Nocardiopsis halotolerans]|uniref:polysaccharide pyruvyl transferase family protein n=1 Tax=Nocardiopsis halotolerans TaxID=124252 RepID=UPI00034DC765|nr:polysaccharide pyruvyl transferase family protein [Nocardiopsis halotolerans]